MYVFLQMFLHEPTDVRSSKQINTDDCYKVYFNVFSFELKICSSLNICPD
jgi:hypothetical protein